MTVGPDRPQIPEGIYEFKGWYRRYQKGQWWDGASNIADAVNIKRQGCGQGAFWSAFNSALGVKFVATLDGRLLPKPLPVKNTKGYIVLELHPVRKREVQLRLL